MRAFVKCMVIVGVLGVFISYNAKSQVREVNFEEFKSYLHKNNDTLYIINFWATWCKPCVEELPYFERINREFKNKKVAVLLVSLDFSKNLESKVIPFVKNKSLNAQVFFLHQPRGHSWMNRISQKWTGAIPATLFIQNKNGQRAFYEKKFKYHELYNIVQQML